MVFIAGLNEPVMPFLPDRFEHDARELLESNERKLLYVGMTRATEMLFLSSSGPPSPFIVKFNPERIKPARRAKINDIYEVTPEAYLFKDKILTPSWRSEEKVRQWVLNELLHTYGYPQSLIDVEYKVNSFSQTIGSVDIVVYSATEGSRVPYIFVEAKAPGSDLAAGRRQLESYMSNCRTCRYGVLTDGKYMLVIDWDFTEIDDIPAYVSPLPLSSIEHYLYTEVRAPRGRHFIVDGAAPEVIIEKVEESEREYGRAELVKIPVFNSIAAGAPAFMNDQAGDRPEILYRKNKVFVK